MPRFVAVRKPELLAPGGSFLSAYHAIEAGADGVYLGLREFSARRAAANFTIEQLRRLRGLAGERAKRLYVAMNTVVRDDEMPRVAESLAWIEALGIDGVIVQDLGVAELARRLFPSISLHASTQMTVHSAEGANLLAALGFRRVILSRELTFEELARLREACRGIELEVFIHGALCYSLSGACLASWAVTGRSGNRGECAQICRSRFTTAGDGRDAGREAAGQYRFSCRDLFLGCEVTKLARIGIDAFKIEGRMKSPEYTAAAVRLYRAIIDESCEGRGLSGPAYERFSRDCELAFAREKTTGWLQSSSGSSLVNTGFPGHRGARLGAAAAVSPARAGRPARIRLLLEAGISQRDGVGWFASGREEPVAFSAHEIRKGGRRVRTAQAGETVEIDLPEDPRPLPAPGDEVRHLSSRSLDLPEPREGSFPAWRMPVEVAAEIRRRWESGATMLLRATGPASAEVEQAVTLEEARTPKPFKEILAPLIAESGGSLFRAAGITLANATDLPDDRIFVPPSELKRCRTLLYQALDSDFLRRLEARAQDAARGPEPKPRLEGCQLGASDRASLSPIGRAPLPFAWLNARSRIEPDALARPDGWIAVPLPTLMPDVGRWIEALEALADEHPEERIAVGLGNVSHLAIAEALAARENVFFFVDVHLYVANRWTVAFITRHVDRLLFAYYWIEGEEEDRRRLAEVVGPGLVSVGPRFRPPLFCSRGCYAKHVLHAGSCPPGCPKSFTRSLCQGEAGFQVVVRDCLTYLLAAH